MHKLKSIFKKDKDTPSESRSSSGGAAYGSTPSGRASYDSQPTGGASSGGASYGSQPTGGASSGGASYGGQPTGGASYGSQPAGGASYGGQSSGGQSSGGASAPTATAFPPSSAPSTGLEHADNAQGVVIHTTLGDITIALYSDQTPRTSKNFATLAATGKYDNVVFHRIIPGFMIQGGDPEGSGRGGRSIYGAKFEDEFVSDLRHTGKGVLSMANSGPNTNGSQFFICLAATPHLDGKHTVFGQVADGMDVVDRLGAVRTGAQDRPVQEVKILRCDVF